MKEVSKQSLHLIRDIIPGQNYANLKARIDQLMPLEYSSMFAKVSFASSSGIWFGNDGVEYKSYPEASDTEKEEVAIAIEECKQYACDKLKREMPFIEKIFVVPSSEEILWYRDSNGATRVLLAQWGFRKKQLGQDVDIIDIIIGTPRTLTQDEVTLKFYYTDGEIADNVPFILQIFNNRKDLISDGNGEYYVGKLSSNKIFSVEDPSGKNHFDFSVAKDADYIITFDWETFYKIVVVNQKGERKPNFKINVNGQEFITNESGEFQSDEFVLTKGQSLSISLPGGENMVTYALKHEPDDNLIEYVVNEKDEALNDTLLPPDPPKPVSEVSVRLLDTDGTPLSGIPFKIVAKGMKDIECLTDGDGVGKFPAELLTHGKRYKVLFHLTPEQRDILDKNKCDNNGQK